MEADRPISDGLGFARVLDVLMREYHISYSDILSKWTSRSVHMFLELIKERYGATDDPEKVSRANEQSVNTLLKAGIAKRG